MEDGLNGVNGQNVPQLVEEVQNPVAGAAQIQNLLTEEMHVREKQRRLFPVELMDALVSEKNLEKGLLI